MKRKRFNKEDPQFTRRPSTLHSIIKMIGTNYPRYGQNETRWVKINMIRD